MERHTTRRAVAALAALAGGYLLYLGANPESAVRTALLAFCMVAAPLGARGPFGHLASREGRGCFRQPG